ncbi:MAG: FtsQ-type POTRA domain-containing protein [Deltaproteobacteria bacterium]|nr:FtsQ-type POTRA domain-containing protein [Deltaproteobacteria bacterium]
MSIFRKKNAEGLKQNRRINSIKDNLPGPVKANKRIDKSNRRLDKSKRKKNSNSKGDFTNRRTKPLFDENIPDTAEDITNSKIPQLKETENTAENKSNLLFVLIIALKTLIFVVMIVLLFKGGQLIYQFGTTSSHFSVKYVEIRGNDRVSNSEIMKYAGFKIGDNIFKINLLQLQNNIDKNPWILKSSVSQKLPSTMIIEVVEREIEMMIVFDVPYIVDSNGELFKRWESGDPMARVILTGISKKDLQEDPQYVENIILDAIALKELYRKTGNEKLAPLNEIHKEADEAFSLTCGKDPFYIKLGHSPYRKKMNRLSILLQKLKQKKQKPAILYFDNIKRPDRVTVKLKKTPREKKEKTDNQ